MHGSGIPAGSAGRSARCWRRSGHRVRRCEGQEDGEHCLKEVEESL